MRSNEETVQTKLQRIALKASNDKRCQFTSLFHLMNKELLLECFTQLKDKAASGIDNITKEAYAMSLEANLENLIERLHKMAYRPQPVLRVYIPKPGSKKRRPLGIPALEDKLVQAGLVKILQAIYEQDFIDDSYGFRPKRSCHDALRALSQAVEAHPVHYMVEADIKGFFDHVDQEQLMAFLQHRIADKRILRYIKRFLKAGIQEDGQHKASERGTPQGGVISPLLANIYLHYTLDLWFEKRMKRNSQGDTRLIRYADDYVACFQFVEDAKQFKEDMESRLNRFHLEVAPEKTRLFEFGGLAQSKAKSRGERTATFDFLGLTHYCSRSRDGKRFRMKRKTIRKRFTAKLKGYKAWLKANRTLPTAQILKTTAAKLRGHFAYYGVTDNSKSIRNFAYQVLLTLFKWLNRRGKRGCYTWEKFNKLLKLYPLPKPRIRVNLFIVLLR
ncbi:MAG: group II intron reverse transcriptase/maturase [Gammaproteobacteria bacterium]|nr:group II intron reverse transcriptase/maturase [Gammaproteobacteria bacterium]